MTTSAAASLRRSVYLPLLRGITPTSLEVFDFADQGLVTGSRSSTIVPTQALYMLNDPFVRRQSLALAERLLGKAELSDAARIDWAYRLALGRAATSQEIERVRSYLDDYEATATTLAAAEPAKPQVVEIAAAPAAVPESAEATAGAAPKKPVPPVNPDEVTDGEAPIVEEAITAGTPRAAAWASFCQALLGSAEFRYLK